MEKAKQKEKEAARPKDQRDRPVEQEGDKDLKEGGMEQAGRQHREK
jgi:hypothetical protein